MSRSDLMKQEVAFVPDALFFVLGFIQTVLFLITTFTYFLLVYVVWVHSPQRIGSYKWYIIINATFGFMFEFFTVSLHMYPLLPYPILVLHGLADFVLIFGEPPQLLIDVAVNMMLASMIGLVFSTACMFVFRWLQTTQSPYLRVATDIRVVFLVYLFNSLIVALTAILPLNLQLLTNEELHAAVYKIDSVVYQKMDGHVVIGFNVLDANYYVFAGSSLFAELMLISVVMLTCAFLCYRYLQKNEYLLTKKTAALFRSLINMLMIDLSFAAVTGFLTITLSMFTFITRVSYGSTIIVCALALSDFYPLFTHLLVLIYIEPYRVASVKFLNLNRFIHVRQAFRWDDTTTSTAVTNVTVVQGTRRSLPL